MCCVSVIGDYWANTFTDRYPGLIGDIPMQITPNKTYTLSSVSPTITREEFDQLKREMVELKELLLAGKKYDEAMGEPDCEMETKVRIIKQVAALVGVDMAEVFGEEINAKRR
jgi:hypothetical protein